MYNLDLEKAEEPETKLPKTGHRKKQGNSRKATIIDYAKAFDCVDHSQEIVKDREAWRAIVHGVSRVRHN